MSHELVNRLVVSLQDRGLLVTLKGLLSKIGDRLFDLRYGTDTAQEVLLTDLAIDSANKGYGVNYMPTHARPLQHLLRDLQLPNEGTFVDLGCGKGKTLLIAAQWGFRKVVGVEFSPELCDQARRNVEIFQSRVPVRSEFEIIQADVAKYQIRPDENVFFMFNPFEEPVMRDVLKNIAQSVEESPRRVWLLYNHPTHDDLILKYSAFIQQKLARYGACEFSVYLLSL
jgi:predicted RNA methylase